VNRIKPQAKVLFEAHLGDLLYTAEREINNIKSECNARGLLTSSITVRHIFEYIEKLVADMAVLAEQCTIQSFEASNFSVNDDLQTELLDSFELNFSLAYPKLVSLADSTTNQIRQSLTNSSLLEWGRLPEVAKLAQVNTQANLRKYYQDLRRKKKKWYEFLPPLAALIRFIFHH